jgi:hypothetical protein
MGADFIQPGLTQLQPPVDDFVEPFSGMYLFLSSVHYKYFLLEHFAFSLLRIFVIQGLGFANSS